MTDTGRPGLDAAFVAMGTKDAALLSVASALLGSRYVWGSHEVAAAARTTGGDIVVGLHVEASQGRASVCAESGVISAAAVAGAAIASLVAVVQRREGEEFLIEPCGVCAELLADYWPDATVWVGSGDKPVRIRARELLPFRRDRAGRLPPSLKENTK